MVILVMVFLIGTFGLNFPIFISTMAVTVFHAGAGEFGLLTSIMAVGRSPARCWPLGGRSPRRALLAGARVFGVGCAWRH